MISLRLFIATLALAVKLDNVRAALTWPSPVPFNYIPSDLIDVNLILQKVPVEAKHYDLYYQTDNCDRRTSGQNPGARCDVHVRSNTIPTNRTITIMQKLDRESLRIYVVLRTENKICATKIIMDGLRDKSANVNQFRKDCLNEYRNVCDITADFGNQCEESRTNIFCSQSKRLICEVDENLPEDTVHQWYQAYSDGSLIGNIPPVTGKKTEFKMTIHKFDNNTYISSVMNSRQIKKDLLTEKLQIPIPKDGYKNYDVKLMKKYTANQVVKLSCSNNAHTQIALIERTGNRIETYNKTAVSWRLTKEHNGSIFCCLNYRTDTVGLKMIVERTVTNITVLVLYEESINPDNKDFVRGVKKPASPQKPTNKGTDSRPHTHNTSADTLGQEGPTPLSGSADPSSDKTNYYIAIPVVGIILLTSLIYVVIKKCCRKSSDQDHTLQLETYATTNTVLYAELDIRPGTGPAPASTDDATYAEIIGVLRPENGHVKK